MIAVLKITKRSEVGTQKSGSVQAIISRAR